MRVGIIGTEQSGKTTLAFAFSKHCEKKGFSVAVCNMDPSLRTSKYPIDWDVRKIIKSKHADVKTYEAIAQDKQTQKALDSLKARLVFLEFKGGLDDFLVADAGVVLRRYCDALLFVMDSSSIREGRHDFDVADALEHLSKRTGLPVVGVLNKNDVGRKKLKDGGLHSFENARSGKTDGVVLVSALERYGFEDLLKTLKPGFF
ncbi:MAG TPA: ATP/GTP-binding protein [Candidatus Norongarragalinales archaeon]|nr:ATP/GTP-binding protein [Candidatus Norongarragalinales archaeon]